jgi:hypothetical protein
MAQNGSLTRNQKRAIAALLSHRDVAAAAQAVGVGTRTLHRWLAEDADFQTALAQAEGAAIDGAVRRLVYLQEPAIMVITQLLADPTVTPSVRLRAALGILDQLIRLRELRNLETRLSKLEEATYGKKS